MQVRTKKSFMSGIGIVVAAAIVLGTVAYGAFIGKPGEKPVFKSRDGIEFVSNIKAGINLGNSLASYNSDETDFGSSDASTETCWGNPRVTKELMESYAANGMDIVRIGVTWGPHTSGAPDYRIDPAYMARVKEVVDYVIDSGMYAVINVHGDDTIWYTMDAAKYAEMSAVQEKLWVQIGSAFSEYDERLLFEACNEPRNIGSSMEWKGGMASDRDTVNKLNFDFVKTVRSLGGNNAKRYLLLPTYAATGNKREIDSMAVPNDERVIVSIHNYNPYEFCSNTENTKKTAWGTAYEKRQVDKYMDYIADAFISRNIPVMFTEFGCVDKMNDLERAEWIEYTMKSGNRYGMPMLWWDNGITEYQYEYGGAFGAFDRYTGAAAHPEIVKALNCLK